MALPVGHNDQALRTFVGADTQNAEQNARSPVGNPQFGESSIQSALSGGSSPDPVAAIPVQSCMARVSQYFSRFTESLRTCWRSVTAFFERRIQAPHVQAQEAPSGNNSEQNSIDSQPQGAVLDSAQDPAPAVEVPLNGVVEAEGSQLQNDETQTLSETD